MRGRSCPRYTCNEDTYMTKTPTFLEQRPKTALVEVYEQTADAVGVDKALAFLRATYGTENPADLKPSQLMDAVDALYELA